jgi:Na+/proline symporter
LSEAGFGGRTGLAVLAAYAVAMLVAGWWASRGRPALRSSLGEYYLAGRSLGGVALFFTLFATQYSGNTLVGYAPAAYRLRYPWWQSVWFFALLRRRRGRHRLHGRLRPVTPGARCRAW